MFVLNPLLLLVEGLLSMGPTPSSSYLLEEMRLSLHLFSANIWCTTVSKL